VDKRFLIPGMIILIILIAVVVSADDVAVTVYNGNLGVVREMRTLEFTKGNGKLSFIDVPSQIDPTSVGFEVKDKTGSVAILEQNYAYDLVSAEKIYGKYIDKEIELIDKSGKVYGGILLSYSGGAVVLKDKSEKIQILRLDEIINTNFPDLPEGLITRPTLFWLYNSNFTGKAACDVSYQTAGLNWTAEYVGILSDDEKNIDLTGWSSITNNSGATFKEATLKLVAGDINRIQEPRMQRLYKGAEMALDASATGAGFEEKEFFEYHLYTLPRRATLADNEIKQISLFDPSQSKVDKKYYFEPEINSEKVSVKLNFINSQEDGLGIPLPAGRARIFKADTDGSMILLGEDRIKHTPKDEKVQLNIGYAFDISAGQKVLNYERITDRVEERTFEISVRNHKKEDITVTVKKRLYGDWTISRNNFDYVKEDANTAVFTIPVKANDKALLNFTARTTQ
jgi:hypothetical protein